VIFFSAYAGIFRAIWYGFYEILQAMIIHAWKLPGSAGTEIVPFKDELGVCLKQANIQPN